MADTWGSIARELSDRGLTRSTSDKGYGSAHERMYPGHRQAAYDAGAGGLLGLLSGSHGDFIQSNKDRMRDLGITPSHRDREGNLTGRYSGADWRDLLADKDTIIRALDYDPIDPGTPLTGPFMGTSKPDGMSWEEYDRMQDKFMGIQDRFGDRTFSPRSRTDRGIAGGRKFGPGNQMDMSGVMGYLPGRMTVGEAKRAREIRNMSRRDREAAGFGEGPYSEFDRISRSHGMRHDRLMDRHRQGQIGARRAHRLAQLALGNTSGTPGMGGHPSQGAGGPNWAALEEAMANQVMRDEFIGRDDRE